MVIIKSPTITHIHYMQVCAYMCVKEKYKIFLLFNRDKAKVSRFGHKPNFVLLAQKIINSQT
jgi:hypothetical protein